MNCILCIVLERRTWQGLCTFTALNLSTKISESVFSGCASPRERAAIGMPWKNWTWSMRINWGQSICNQSVSGRQKAATGHDSVISQQLKCWAYLQRVKCTKFIIMISLPSSLHFWLQMDEYIFLQGLRYQYIQKCFYLWCQSPLYLANNYAWVLESAELFLLFLLKYSRRSTLKLRLFTSYLLMT